MKIELITLHRVRNYGSSLQTLATQLFFEENGFDVEVIDYYQGRYSSLGLLKRLKNKSKRLENNVAMLLAAQIAISFSYIKKKIIFDSFLKKYIHLSPKIYKTEDDLLANYPAADAYCTGSDQVWNSHWNEGIDAPLYLSFLKKDEYRFSYASSIGNSSLSDEEKLAILPYLEKYEHITVRENKGVDILSEIGIKNVTQMLDPTLLFDYGRWNKYTSNKFKNKKYIVTYNLHHDSRIDEYANLLGKQKGIKVYNISYNWHDVVRKGHLKWCPSVEEYLGLIRDAEYVVTDSFHATVFSLIFSTKFIDIYPQEASSRLRSLLELTGLTERGFDNMPPIEAADAMIEFDKVHAVICEEKKRAYNYITTIKNELVSRNE